MTNTETDRLSAVPIGRVTCLETGEEIGLVYQWNNGETQVALYSEWDIEKALAELET